MFEDKTLVCKDCGEEFVFTAREQEFYESKGFVKEHAICDQQQKRRWKISTKFATSHG